jgi:hypothetical protein
MLLSHYRCRPPLIQRRRIYRASSGLLDAKGVVLVAASDNTLSDYSNKAVDSFPALFTDPDPSKNPDGLQTNLILVRSTDIDGYEAMHSQSAPYVDLFAPGWAIHMSEDPKGGMADTQRLLVLQNVSALFDSYNTAYLDGWPPTLRRACLELASRENYWHYPLYCTDISPHA